MTSAARIALPPLGRPFLTVWFGQTVSAVGSTVSAVGVSVWVYVETGSTLWLGVLAALAGVPVLLASPLMPLVDRLTRRTAMLVADTLAATGTVIALLLAATGRLEVWHVAIAGFLAGFGTALQVPAFQAAIPHLVAPTELARANGLNQFGPAAGIVLGPAIATPLVAWVGIEAVLVVDVVTFVVAVACTAFARFGDTTSSEDDQQRHDDGSWTSAMRWLTGLGRPLFVLLLAMAVVNFCLAFFNVSGLALATTVGGPARAGFAFAAGGVAMIVSSLVLGRFGLPARRVRAMTAGLATVGIGCVVSGLRPNFVVVVLGSVVLFAAVPVLQAAASTVFHERVPPSMYGRVFGLRSAIARSLDPVGSVMAGFVIARFAEPTMRADGIGAATLGRLIGSGAERGTALVVVTVGIVVVGLALAQHAVVASELDRAHDADREDEHVQV